MGLSTMACSKTERNGGKEPTNGLMNLFTSEIGSTTILKEMVSIDGPMAEFTKVNGKKISSTVVVSTLGLMEESMRATTKMTRNTVLALTLGLTANPTKVSGLMESNMEKLDSQTLKAGVKWAFGKTERGLNGLMQSRPCSQNHLLLTAVR